MRSERVNLQKYQSIDLKRHSVVVWECEGIDGPHDQILSADQRDVHGDAFRKFSSLRQ
jgi:hypothetical protein